MDSPEEDSMPCMLLLPVQDRGCEVKQAAAHLQTLPWKWLFALVWWFITWYSALGLLADGDGINSCAGLGGVSGTRRPAGPASCCASHGISTFIPYFIPSATKEFFLPEACGPCFTVNPAGSFVCIEWCLLASPKRVLRMQTETSGLMLRSCSC